MSESARPSIARVSRFGLVVSDIHDAEQFFQQAFDLETVERRPGDPAYAELMGLHGVQSRHTLMRLGQQEIELVAFDPPGRPYPSGSTSSDLWFQHFAIIVADMAAAYAQLEVTGRFVPISDGGPVQLPQSSGGVQAFKFRDLDGHPLELLAFPEGGAPDAWKAKHAGDLFLGIDHSAISVSSTAASIAFFQACFGLTQSMQSENVGPEQSRMDAVADARVTVTGLAPHRAPPHVELLGYHVGERRPIDGHTAANDIAATYSVLQTDNIEPVVEALTANGAIFVSPGVVTLGNGARAIAVLDPDGHRFVVEEH